MTQQKHIAIIGAGATGLAAAWDVLRAGHRVTLYEAGERIGGLAAGFKDDGWAWWLEKFYHHWFESDHAILNLIREMGHGDKILFPRPKTSYWINGKLYRSEISPSALLLPIPPLAKLRFGAVGAFLKLAPATVGQYLERFTADEFLRYFMGEAPYQAFFKPLLIGKFGTDYDKVNMAWMWARIKARSLRLGTFAGGFQTFLDLLGQMLIERGAVIQLQTPVERIALDGLTPTLTIGGQSQPYDAILSTTAPHIMLRLTPALAATHYGDQLADLKSIGGLCVVLALRQQLLTDGTYWLNLPATTADKTRNAFPFLALVEHTNYLDKAHYGGDHIVYCGDYAPPDHEYFTLPEDALIARFLPALQRVNPAFDASWIRKAWVWRAPYAQPLPFVYHSDRLPPLATPLPGVYFACMSQVYPWDRGTNYAVEMGRRVAQMMLAASG